MEEFVIYKSTFGILAGSYLSLFAVVWKISHTLQLVKREI